jgi:hypothetical protein
MFTLPLSLIPRGGSASGNPLHPGIMAFSTHLRVSDFTGSDNFSFKVKIILAVFKGVVFREG